MLYYVLMVLSWLVAHIPVRVLEILCYVLGRVAMVVLPSRRRLVLSNLVHAFPGRDARWYRRMCKLNFARLIELGSLALAINFLSEDKVREYFKVGKQEKKCLDDLIRSNKGGIVLLPHLSLMEAMTTLPMLLGQHGNICTLYRPFDNPGLEKFIKKSRERFGLKLISRKGGIFEAAQILNDGAIVAMLFDQNAGDSGYKTLFFNRVVSSTNLPALLFERAKCPVYFIYPRRIGFWRANIVVKELKFDHQDSKTIIFAANGYLEHLLKKSDNMCADWLWAHNRWRISERNMNLFQEGRKNWIKENIAYNGAVGVDKKFVVAVRMPNWLGDIVMAVPILRMIKKSHKDVRLVVFCGKNYVSFLETLKVADEVVGLPKKGLFYFRDFKKRRQICDVYISLINSLRGDIEAVLMNAPYRLGVLKDRRRFYRKFFINYLYSGFAEADSTHQTVLWEKMLHNFGFQGNIDCSCYKFCSDLKAKDKNHYSIGLICGSLHDEKKRWPVESWKILIERFIEWMPSVKINLYGTAADKGITDEIAMFFNRSVITNLAGQTNILQLVNFLQNDDLVVAIDTGGMHLANMFGRPLVCLFGMTNAAVTGPIFDGPVRKVMPEGCPLKGGFPTEDIRADAVFQAAQKQLLQYAKRSTNSYVS